MKKGKDLDTSFSISSAFAELIEKDSYSNISIDNICKTANVSKKTFYRYYDNKEALVREIIRNDFVYPVISLREILPVSEIKSSTVLMLERHYQAMEKHRDFYRGLMEAQGWSWLADIMIDEMHQLQKKLYHAPDFARYNFDEAELDYISYLFSAASVMISLWWIRSDTDIDSKRLTKLDDTWRFAHWRELAGYAPPPPPNSHCDFTEWVPVFQKGWILVACRIGASALNRGIPLGRLTKTDLVLQQLPHRIP